MNLFDTERWISTFKIVFKNFKCYKKKSSQAILVIYKEVKRDFWLYDDVLSNIWRDYNKKATANKSAEATVFHYASPPWLDPPSYRENKAGRSRQPLAEQRPLPTAM